MHGLSLHRPFGNISNDIDFVLDERSTTPGQDNVNANTCLKYSEVRFDRF